jgi:peptidoglycan/LPS O-acetylase OafA/YrhL
LAVRRYASIAKPRVIMRETPTTPPANRLLGLEALRFATAFAVLIWHYQHFAHAAGMPADFIKAQLPFYGVLYPFYQVGNFGVCVFWGISGFIFFWKYRDAISQRSIGAWEFFVFRLPRLYPLHFATLMMVASLQPIYHHLHGRFFIYSNNDLGNFVLELFMASAWGLQPAFGFNGAIWSVSTEILVYTAFFLALRFVTRSVLLNVVVVAACANVTSPIGFCLTCFYTGGLAALGRQAMARSQFRLPIEAAAWCAALAIAVYLGMSSQQIATPYGIVLLSIFILLFCLSGNVPLPPPWQRLLEAAGSMTYSSYLLQFPIQLVIVIAFTILQRPIPLYDELFFTLSVGATLLASFFTYRYFEAPAQALIRGYLLSNRRWPLGKAAVAP